MKVKVPVGYPHPDSQTAEELHDRLVQDAVKGIATPLHWAVYSYQRISKLLIIDQETAFQRVVGEVKELTGRGMPVV